MKIEYYENMLEQEAINKYLNMIANDYNGELAKMFQEKYINKDKEIERLKEELKYTIPIVEHNKTITKHLKEIERLHSIIKEAKDFINGKDLKENEYRFAEYFDFAKLLEILDKEKV